jgi:hypothetical protein
MWSQKIEYVDAEVTLPPPVKKQVWDAETSLFVPMTLYRRTGVPDQLEIDWLYNTYGPKGVYKDGRFWDYSRAGNFTVMDQKVYAWYQMKWGNK